MTARSSVLSRQHFSSEAPQSNHHFQCIFNQMNNVKLKKITKFAMNHCFNYRNKQSMPNSFSMRPCCYKPFLATVQLRIWSWAMTIQFDNCDGWIGKSCQDPKRQSIMTDWSAVSAVWSWTTKWWICTPTWMLVSRIRSGNTAALHAIPILAWTAQPASSTGALTSASAVTLLLISDETAKPVPLTFSKQLDKWFNCRRAFWLIV